jgi:4-hydroxybenzoyl-CoA thioesterase
MTTVPSVPSSESYTQTLRVPFSMCDPAGIVFFVQYHLMFQNLVESWITERLGVDYSELLGPRRVGLPTVRLETDFRASSRMGDRISVSLRVEHVGTKSLVLQLAVHGDDGHLRVEARQVIVCTSLDTHRSQPFPDDLRTALLRFCATP